MRYNFDEVKKFLEDFNRMCQSGNCATCDMLQNKYGYTCSNMLRKLPVHAIEIVSNWCEEHPKKTYKTDYLEKFPNNRYGRNHAIVICCGNLYGFSCPQKLSCDDCWNREME